MSRTQEKIDLTEEALSVLRRKTFALISLRFAMGLFPPTVNGRAMRRSIEEMAEELEAECNSLSRLASSRLDRII